ncbi:hypothetical protein BKA62DRAFT_697167, partial [Auriculariales sp. MPI-PUGE-AT-0066]
MVAVMIGIVESLEAVSFTCCGFVRSAGCLVAAWLLALQQLGRNLLVWCRTCGLVLAVGTGYACDGYRGCAAV